MNWTITEEELARFEQQQNQLRYIELGRHLLTLPNAPTSWQDCLNQVKAHDRIAQHYRITQLDNIKKVITALHFVPTAIENEQVNHYLSAKGLEGFRTQRLLEWVNAWVSNNTQQ